ncbi:hypothetical protein M0R45_016672 [Rubus argutus]|uniref:Uncharacterized protein n=1 Tax=Rubus argutus TaxID=59490 RepID=A0AAW1XU18_RUBAR
MSGKTSKKKKFQKIDVYDGSTDPYDHLGKNATEANRYKAFPQTLKGNYHRCEGADEKIAYAALMGGFRSGPLFKVIQDPPGSFKALVREATNYSRAENLNCSRGMDVHPQPPVGTKRNSGTASEIETFTNNKKGL